jgi:hypothetical protein
MKPTWVVPRTRVQLWWQQQQQSSLSASFVTVFEQDARCGQLPPAIHIEEVRIPLEYQHIKTAFLRLEFDT